ncbi:hypothetical protein LXL04_036001 [Taraxacum kok-saghyz]
MFITIASEWGEVVQADLCNFGNNLCDRGIVCIKTKIKDIICESVQMLVDKEEIMIRVKEVEDSSFQVHDIVSKKYAVEESDEDEDQEYNCPESSSEEEQEIGSSAEGENDTEIEETELPPIIIRNDQTPMMNTLGNEIPKAADQTDNKSNGKAANGKKPIGSPHLSGSFNSDNDEPKRKSPSTNRSVNQSNNGYPEVQYHKPTDSLNLENETFKSGTQNSNMPKSQLHRNKLKKINTELESWETQLNGEKTTVRTGSITQRKGSIFLQE